MGFRGLGFRGLGFRGLGFRGLGFKLLALHSLRGTRRGSNSLQQRPKNCPFAGSTLGAGLKIADLSWRRI